MMALMPLSTILIKVLLLINIIFSDAIHMRFGIEKCATASIISRGKLVVSDDLVVANRRHCNLCYECS